MSGGFSFGQNSFSFGTPKTTAPATTAATGFGFGASAAAVPGIYFSKYHLIFLLVRNRIEIYY